MEESLFDPREQHSNTAARMVYGLERISEAFRVLLWRETRASGLSPIQIQLLIFILYQPESRRRVSLLAREFNMTKATISEVVKTLSRKNLVRKEPDPHDTRSAILHLTDQGEMAAKRSALFASPLSSPLREFSPERLDEMMAGLVEMLHSLEKQGVLEEIRTCTGCKYYSKTVSNGFTCSLLEKEMRNRELRTDCPEFEPILTEHKP